MIDPPSFKTGNMFNNMAQLLTGWCP